MKSAISLFFIPALLTISVLFACGQGNIKTPPNAMNKFDEFKAKEKFNEDIGVFYPGLANPSMKSDLSNKINLAADDFRKVAETGNGTAKDYQDKIKLGLDRFKENYLNLDTEDRERICLYFEELMDIVGLESSGGLLNKFMYGFDPSND